MASPAPTAPDHSWACSSCRWRGDTLVAAKGHLLEAAVDSPFPHHPFEAPRAKLAEARFAMSEMATRIMLPHSEDGKVMVSAYSTARRRLYGVLDPLVQDLARRHGRLKAGTRGA
jgi:hypothetical protein